MCCGRSTTWCSLKPGPVTHLPSLPAWISWQLLATVFFGKSNAFKNANGKKQGKNNTFRMIEMHQFPYSHYNSNIFEPWPAPIRSTTSSLQKGRQSQLHEWCWWQLLKILGPTNGDMINDRIPPRHDGNRVDSFFLCCDFFRGCVGLNQNPPRLFLGSNLYWI